MVSDPYSSITCTCSLSVFDCRHSSDLHVNHSQIVPDLKVRDVTMGYDAVVMVLKIVCVNRLK